MQLVPHIKEEDDNHDDDTQSTTPETLAMTTDTVAVVPDTVQPATGNTQRTHTLITEAQAETLGEVSRPEQGRNANATKQNAVRGIGIVLSFVRDWCCLCVFCQGVVFFVVVRTSVVCYFCQGLVLGSCCQGLLFCVDPWWLCARAGTFSTDANTSVVFVRVSLIVDNNDHHGACYFVVENKCPDLCFHANVSQVDAIALEKQHPVDTSPPPKQTCEKCKMKLEKEAGEMDQQNLGVYLQLVCEREGGDTALCVKIGQQYHANQLHDGTNLDLALGRFCHTFYGIPCTDEEEEEKDGGRGRRLRRRRLR